jgi:hypothetical protein
VQASYKGYELHFLLMKPSSPMAVTARKLPKP